MMAQKPKQSWTTSRRIHKWREGASCQTCQTRDWQQYCQWKIQQREQRLPRIPVSLARRQGETVKIVSQNGIFLLIRTGTENKEWLKQRTEGEATSQAAHTDGAYPGFRSIKRLGIFLLPPEWDASPLQGSPPALCRRYPFIHLGGERHYECKVSCPRTQHKWPRLGLELGPLYPESGALTIRPPRLPKQRTEGLFKLKNSGQFLHLPQWQLKWSHLRIPSHPWRYCIWMCSCHLWY